MIYLDSVDRSKGDRISERIRSAMSTTGNSWRGYANAYALITLAV
ncbi:MAG: hypothetical protein V7K97_09035 [Nostoc sp.]